MWITGIILAISAATLGTISKQLIATSKRPGKEVETLFRLGAFLNAAVGPIVDASAYAFAPQVVVAPLACLDVVMNALTAPHTLHWQREQLTWAHVVGVILVTAGACITSVFADAADSLRPVQELERLLIRPAALAYMGSEVFLLGAILFWLQTPRGSPGIRGISLGVAAGMLMGNVFFMKSLLCIIRGGDLSTFRGATPYLLLIATVSGPIFGHILMRKALAEFKGVYMVTVFEGAHIAAACLSGCVVMREMADATWENWFLYWLGVVLILGGLAVINTAAPDAQLPEIKVNEPKQYEMMGAEESSHLLGNKESSHLLGNKDVSVRAYSRDNKNGTYEIYQNQSAEDEIL